jgi:hypothetical protein
MCVQPWTYVRKNIRVVIALILEHIVRALTHASSQICVNKSIHCSFTVTMRSNITVSIYTSIGINERVVRLPANTIRGVGCRTRLSK